MLWDYCTITGWPADLETSNCQGILHHLKEVRKFHKYGKKQGKVRKFWSDGMNVAGTSFNTVSILSSHNSFYLKTISFFVCVSFIS